MYSFFILVFDIQTLLKSSFREAPNLDKKISCESQYHRVNLTCCYLHAFSLGSMSTFFFRVEERYNQRYAGGQAINFPFFSKEIGLARKEEGRKEGRMEYGNSYQLASYSSLSFFLLFFPFLEQ